MTDLQTLLDTAYAEIGRLTVENRILRGTSQTESTPAVLPIPNGPRRTQRVHPKVT